MRPKTVSRDRCCCCCCCCVVAVVAGSIFTGPSDSFVCLSRPARGPVAHRSLGDTPGSPPGHTRSRPAVINARPSSRPWRWPSARGRARREIESESSGRMNSLPYHRPGGGGGGGAARRAPASASERRTVDLSAASFTDNIVTPPAPPPAAAAPSTD